MKTILKSTILALMTTSALSAAPSLPPKDRISNWNEFEPGIENLKFSSYSGFDFPFDGGSTCFFFVGSKKQHYTILKANRAYWTDVEKASKTQVYFLVNKNKFYRLDKGSKEEAKVIALIKELPQKPILKKLIENLKSRKASSPRVK